MFGPARHFCGAGPMNRLIANTVTCTLTGLLSIPTMAQNPAKKPAVSPSQTVLAHDKRWIGTWATAPQPFMPGSLQSFRNQSLRLIVHTSAGGTKVRIKISNTFGDHPLLIGGAHIARRTAAADIDPSSDRTLMFHGRSSTTVPARSTGGGKFPAPETVPSWPFLTGGDFAASAHGASIVAFGSSLTDGDGSTLDTNRRWPDVLAERLQKGADGKTEVGVLNQGIIGNRLLNDSPRQAGSPFGAALGQAGLARFERDVLAQAGIRYVIVGLGINDIVFPGSLTPLTERMSAESMISGYRQLIRRAHQKGIRVIGTTNPPFENAFLVLSETAPPATFYIPEKEIVRQKVNDWIRSSGEFDDVLDFDVVLRDPSHPTRLLPIYDSGDHLHPNNAGYIAAGNAIPLAWLEVH